MGLVLALEDKAMGGSKATSVHANDANRNPTISPKPK
jgi:hypothetical protein